MSETPRAGGQRREIILVVDHEVVARQVLVEYLRECGYGVVEVGATEQSLSVLAAAADRVNAILCRTDAIGEVPASELARRIREEHPEVVVMIAGSLETAASIAGELCDEVPDIGRPYDPAAVVDEIRRRLAERGEV